jgi:hypothetical protein
MLHENPRYESQNLDDFQQEALKRGYNAIIPSDISDYHNISPTPIAMWNGVADKNGDGDLSSVYYLIENDKVWIIRDHNIENRQLPNLSYNLLRLTEEEKIVLAEKGKEHGVEVVF